MSTGTCERVRVIPLNVKNIENHIIPEAMEEEEFTGFPFDRDTDRTTGNRDPHLRSQLDDIAQRHPEFAQHLGNFRPRHSSASEDEPELRRRFERPFGTRFERFGFPFDRDGFDPEQYAQQFYAEPEQAFQQQQGFPQQQQQQNFSQQQQEFPQQQQGFTQHRRAEARPNEQEGCANPERSNTTDFGQKQDAEGNNERGQRSMSAPPSENQRFTSSIHIPVNQPVQETMSQPQAEQKSTERIIPIHIEGRDEPVLPRAARQQFQPRTEPQQGFSQPQAERIFGQMPEHFTQFVNQPRQFQDGWHNFNQDELPRQQRFAQAQKAPEVPVQVQKEPAKEQSKGVGGVKVEAEQPKESAEAPKAAQQCAKLSSIEQIQAIQKDVSQLMGQVERYTGKTKDKQYIYLDEMLTRNLLKLDNIDTQGQDAIRSARKEAVRCIEGAIAVLEAKAAGKVQVEKMDVEEKREEVKKEKKEENASAEDGNKEINKQSSMETEAESLEKLTKNENKQQTNVESEEQKVVSNETAMEAVSVNENEKKTEPVDENKEKMGPVDADTAENTTEKPLESVEKPAEEPKPEEKPAAEGENMEDANLPVSEAVKKFEDKMETNTNKDVKKDSSQAKEEEEAKVGDKKEKKKIKKKVDKKEK